MSKFTNSLPKGIGEIHDPDIHQSINISHFSAQHVELEVLFHLLQLIHEPKILFQIMCLL